MGYINNLIIKIKKMNKEQMKSIRAKISQIEIMLQKIEHETNEKEGNKICKQIILHEASLIIKITNNDIDN